MTCFCTPPTIFTIVFAPDRLLNEDSEIEVGIDTKILKDAKADQNPLPSLKQPKTSWKWIVK